MLTMEVHPSGTHQTPKIMRCPLLLALIAATLCSTLARQEPPTNHHSTFQITSIGTGTIITAPYTQQYITTNGLLTKYYLGHQRMIAPPPKTFIAELKPPRHDHLVRGLDIIFNLTVQICTATHLFPIQAKVFNTWNPRPKCKKPDASLPPLFQDEPKQAHIDQIANILTAAEKDRSPVFVGPYNQPSRFHPTPNATNNPMHIFLICNMTHRHCLEPSIIAPAYRPAFSYYVNQTGTLKIDTKLLRFLEYYTISYGPFKITKLHHSSFLPNQDTPPYPIICAAKPKHLTNNCALKISEQATTFENLRIKDNKIRELSETASQILYKHKTAKITKRANTLQNTLTTLAHTSGIGFLVSMFSKLFAPSQTNAITDEVIKQHIKEIRTFVEDLEAQLHHNSLNQAYLRTRIWANEQQIMTTFITQTSMHLKQAIEAVTTQFEDNLNIGAPSVKKLVLDTYPIQNHPPISPQYKNLRLTYHRGRNAYTIRLEPIKPQSSVNLTIYQYIRTGYQCVTATNTTIKAPGTNMSITFPKHTKEQTLMDTLNIPASPNQTLIGIQPDGYLYINHSCINPATNTSPCIPDYHLSHKTPQEPALMHVQWICENIHPDHTEISPTGISITSTVRTALTITTCKNTTTFTIPIPPGITTVNLANDTHSNCTTNPHHYTYLPPTSVITNHTIRPTPSKKQTITWADISQIHREKLNKTVYDLLYLRNTTSFSYTRLLNITSGEVLFDIAQQNQTINNTSTDIISSLSNIFTDWQWPSLDIFGWWSSIGNTFDKVYNIIIAAAITTAIVFLIIICIKCCPTRTKSPATTIHLDITSDPQHPTHPSTQPTNRRNQKNISILKHKLMQEATLLNNQETRL